MRFLIGLLVGLALGLPCAAAGEVEIERMTSPEVAAAIKAGAATIIIPTGGTEQNGPHMVLGKHNYIVAETARRIARKLGNALVAPVMAYVPEGDIATREGHMAYAGTISVAPPVYAAVLEAAAASLKTHGFKTIVFLGDSGPNQAPQQVVAAKLSAQWAGDGVRVLNADTYYSANGGVEWLKSLWETDKSIGSHAAIRDTSELMAIYPEGIRMDKRVADKDGVVGDPSRATAERGAKLLDLKVDAALQDIAKGLKAPVQPAPSEGLWARIKHWLSG